MTREEILYVASRRGKSCYDLIVNVYDELYKELNSRSCKSCKYFVEDLICKQPHGDGYCCHKDIGVYDIEYPDLIALDVFEDFCCNRYVIKDK